MFDRRLLLGASVQYCNLVGGTTVNVTVWVRSVRSVFTVFYLHHEAKFKRMLNQDSRQHPPHTHEKTNKTT